MGIVTTGRRSRAALILVTGLAAMLCVGTGDSLLSAPLFDGVFTEEPYRYVDPHPDGAPDPAAASAGYPVTNGAVALIALATTEVPPQAQLIVQADAFAVSPETTSLTVSIQPESAPDGDVQGNLYRIQATDQAGAQLQIRAGAVVTIVLRAPQANVDAEIGRRDGTTWIVLPSDNGGLPDLLYANVDQLGDFAILLPGSSPSTPPSSGPGGTQGIMPNWLAVAFLIAAGTAWLLWARLSAAAKRRTSTGRASKPGGRQSRSR